MVCNFTKNNLSMYFSILKINVNGFSFSKDAGYGSGKLLKIISLQVLFKDFDSVISAR